MTIKTTLQIKGVRFKIRALWLWRAWPFITMALIVMAHWELLQVLPAYADCINTWTSAGSQIVGGFIIIFSLSQNLKLFGKVGLKAVFKNWIKEYPRFKTVTAVGSASGSMSVSGVGAVAFGTGGPQTIDERLAALELQLKTLTQDLVKKEKALIGRIDQLSAVVSKNAQDAQTALLALTDKVKETAVGGLKPQLFGALLATYGVLVGALA